VALVAAGNLVVDRGSDGAGSAVRIAGSAFAPIAGESPPGLAFDLVARVAQYRLDTAAARLARGERGRRQRRGARRREGERFGRLPGGVSRATLESIAACESGGDPRIISSNGLYHGKYQFSVDTWESVGGEGSPARASEAEQDFRAALLYARSGPGQWPVCGS